MHTHTPLIFTHHAVAAVGCDEDIQMSVYMYAHTYTHTHITDTHTHTHIYTHTHTARNSSSGLWRRHPSIRGPIGVFARVTAHRHYSFFSPSFFFLSFFSRQRLTLWGVLLSFSLMSRPTGVVSPSIPPSFPLVSFFGEREINSVKGEGGGRLVRFQWFCPSFFWTHRT